MSERTGASATLRYARISPSKVKIVLDTIRNKPVDEALAILNNTPKVASELLVKLLKSAIANAEYFGFSSDNLCVSQAYANEGPTLKRIRPRAQGRAFRIRKRTSHITLAVSEK